MSTGGKLNNSFRYELRSLNTDGWSTFKFRFLGIISFAVLGQYTNKEKALTHLKMYHRDGRKDVFLLDTVTGAVSK